MSGGGHHEPEHEALPASEGGILSPWAIVGMAVLAWAVRCQLTETYSRVQVVAFVAVAVIVEAGRALRFGRPPALLSVLALWGGAVAGIVLAKWQIEGISLDHWMRQLRAFAALWLRR